MLDPNPSRPDPGMSSSNLLNPRVRRDIADLNEIFLGRALHPIHGLDPWFRLPAAAAARLRDAPAESIRRAARCPFALFEVALPPAGEVEAGAGDAVADGPDGDAPGQAHREARRAFGMAALGLVRTLSEGTPLAPRIAFGLRTGTEERLAGLSLADSYHVANWHGLIRPRWHRHERYWNLLAELVGSEETVRWAYAAGVCLLAQCDRRQAVPTLEPRRASRHAHRRPPRGDRGVPC